MIGAMLRRNLRQQGRLLTALVVALVAVQVLFIQVAAALEAGPGFANLVQMLPVAIQSLFGNQIMMASFNGASAFGFQHPAVITASLAFCIVACTIPAGERESGTLELLLARPIPRWRYLMGSLGVALLGVVVFPVVLMAGVAIGLATVTVPGELAWHRYVPSALGLAVLLLTFTGITLALSATAARRGPAVARSVGVIMTLYLVDVFGERLTWLAWLRWASPFRQFRPVNWTVLGDVPVGSLLLWAAVGVIAIGAAFLWFGRGDAVGGRW